MKLGDRAIFFVEPLYEVNLIRIKEQEARKGAQFVPIFMSTTVRQT